MDNKDFETQIKRSNFLRVLSELNRTEYGLKKLGYHERARLIKEIYDSVKEDFDYLT